MKKKLRLLALDVITLALGLLVITPLLYGFCGAFKTPS